jgi:sorbitol-specific phosphotransferase system component IIC
MYEILTWLMLCVWAAYSLGRLLNRIIAEKERRDYAERTGRWADARKGVADER